jgi:carboxypeptidase Taq
MDELLERLAEVADLERTAVLLAWIRRCACRPPAPPGTASCERRSGASPTSVSPTSASASCWKAAQPRDELEADAVRVAQRDFDKARRVPGELVAEVARTATAAPVAQLETRQR